MRVFKTTEMLSPSAILLLIYILHAHTVDASAKPRFRCPKDLPHCSCISIDSNRIEYACNDDKNNEVTLDCSPTKEVKITCKTNTTAFKEWYSLFRGIDLAENYIELTIQQCPIPDRPLKDILALLSIRGIQSLAIDYTLDPQHNYQADHFRDLNNVTIFFFRNNNVSSFSNDTLSGLSNVNYLLLNLNNLQRFSPNFFQPVPNVTFLDLAGNNLTELDEHIFEPLSNLHTLNLNVNRLGNLSRALFTPLRRTLSRLDLSQNGIKTLNEPLFQDLPRLDLLHLSFNNISVIAGDALKGLKKLRIFKAQRAFRKNTTLPSALFSYSKSLVDISLDSNGLTHLPDTIFQGLINLTKLSLSRNRLTELPPGLFETTPNISKIDLSKNKLTSLGRTTFRGLGQLIELSLADNELSYISGNAFDDLKSLQKLYLENNRLSRVESGVFDRLRSLEFISLDHNQLDMRRNDGVITSDSLLRDCISLREIHLRNNSVEQIFGDWLALPTKLKTLDLAYNKMRSLQATDLNFVQASETYSVDVNLEHNNITTFNLENHERYVQILACVDGRCAKKHDLKISLLDNPIVCDCKNYDFIRMVQGNMSSAALDFVSLKMKEELKCDGPKHLANKKLIEVDLTDLYCPMTECPQSCTCHLRAVDRVTVVNCTKAEVLPTWLPNGTNAKIELILTDNRLKNLRQISSLIHRNVTKLCLSRNYLKNIDDLLLPRALKVLELHSNNMSVLDKKTVDALNQTRARISLHDNPWACDCRAQYLLDFIKYRISESLMPNGNLIKCDETHQAIIQLSVDDLCSNSRYLYIICVTLALFGLLFGALTIVYLKYEHEIKVFMFAHKICLWLVTEKGVDRDKEFDAFISYAHEDEKSIVTHLVSNLENGPYPYKLCLHYRNWPIGGLIPEQILWSVGSSRRTIIVLSRSYLKSKWANLEFRTAYLQALKERHTRLIVILVDDSDKNAALDPELKAYITMNTYLKWGDSQFWEKLRYAMPHPQNYRKMKSSKKRKAHNILDEENRRKLMEAFNMWYEKSAKISNTEVIVR